MPTPLMTTGTIIGEITTARIIDRAGSRPRDMPSAASVPSTVDTNVAPAPMIRLWRSADIQGCGCRIFSYHCSEKPGSG